MSFWKQFFQTTAPGDASTRAKRHVADLLARGLVEKVLLLPKSLGGAEIPQNETYLPVAAARAKAVFDEKVTLRVQAGEAVEYSAAPEYDDDTLVPAKLHLKASGPARVVSETLDVRPLRTW